MSNKTPSQKLVPQENDIFDPEVPALAPPKFTDTPEFEAEDLSWPRLSLLQGISPAVMDPESSLKAGNYNITGDETNRKTVNFIPLRMAITRRYEVGPKENRTLLCQSNDNRHGVGNPGGECRTCPMAQWQEDPDRPGKRFLPCQPAYNYVGYVPEDDNLVSLTLARTATQAAKTINGRVATHGMGKFPVLLGARLVQGEGNTYFVPTVKFPRPDPEALDNAKLSLPSDS